MERAECIQFTFKYFACIASKNIFAIFVLQINKAEALVKHGRLLVLTHQLLDEPFGAN